MSFLLLVLCLFYNGGLKKLQIYRTQSRCLSERFAANSKQRKQPDLLKGLVSYPNFLFLPGEIHTVKDYIIGVFLTSIAEPGAGLLVGCDIDSTYKFSKFRKYVETKLISFDLWFPDTFDVWAILDKENCYKL